MAPDVLVVGAGPAGATAALVLARAGARVRLIDRASFPRPKLCGDTLNPGTLAILRRLGVADSVTAGALPLRGMRLTGPGGVTVQTTYGRGLSGVALTRLEFDARLLDEAIAAGAEFEPCLRVTRPLVVGGGQALDGGQSLDAGHEIGLGRSIGGVLAARHDGATFALEAPVTIAADGRASTLAFATGLARRPVAPRRWAIGAYFHGISRLEPLGEMHVRPGWYLGVAPLPGGIANVILVVPAEAVRRHAAKALPHREGVLASLLERTLARDPELADRFAAARRIGPPTTLGPLAVETTGVSVPGLLLAGDAAGFIDPMTGDGMRFAIRGGELAAEAALQALAHGWGGVGASLARRRRDVFHAKWRFNRAVRRLTGSAAAVGTMAAVAPILPALLRWTVRYAGDCRDARG